MAAAPGLVPLLLAGVVPLLNEFSGWGFGIADVDDEEFVAVDAPTDEVWPFGFSIWDSF